MPTQSLNKRRLYFTLILALITLIFWLLLHLRSLHNRLEPHFEKIYMVMHIIQKYYVTDMDLKTIMNAGIQGMLNELDFPGHLNGTNNNFTPQTNVLKDSVGLGLHLMTLKKYPIVVSTAPFSPATMVGIKPGTILSQIDGKSTHRLPLSTVYRLLRGPVGTFVNLKFSDSPIQEYINLPFQRQKSPSKSIITSFFLDQQTAFIKLAHFKPETASAVEKALSEFKSNGMQRLIFDLRQNSVGTLREAIQIMQLFLPQDELLLEIKGHNSEFYQKISTDSNGSFIDLPLVIIIDNGSAYSAEAMAGVFQDLDRAIIVGENSFGLAQIRMNYALSDSTRLNLTVAQFYTPTQRCPGRLFGKLGFEDLTNALNSVAPDSLRINHGIFKTLHGRAVYAHEGIIPDKTIRRSPITRLYQTIVKKQLFTSFYQLFRPEMERERLTFNQMSRQNLNNALWMKRFNAFLKRKNIKIMHQDWQSARKQIARRIQLMRIKAKFGTEKMYMAAMREDPIIKASQSAFFTDVIGIGISKLSQ